MLEINADNAVDYLRQTGRLTADEPACVQALAWGVSNVVLRVEPAASEHFVIKQSREKLRTRADWFSRLDRIWREAELIRCLEPILPAGAVPRLLFEDRDNYLFAMEAIAADHLVWKAELLAGRFSSDVAARMGDCLACLHRETFDSAALRAQFGDRQVFVELRVDPFYRRLADVHPDLRGAIDDLIAEMFATDVCVTHADFSPKNILIAGDRLVLVDYETGHFGDPAFDLGFFLSHLLLKVVLHAERGREVLQLARSFWDRYRTAVAPLDDRAPVFTDGLQGRAVGHLALCMLARIDGTSPVDYLDSDQQRFAREFAIDLFRTRPERLDDAIERLETALARRS